MSKDANSRSDSPPEDGSSDSTNGGGATSAADDTRFDPDPGFVDGGGARGSAAGEEKARSDDVVFDEENARIRAALSEVRREVRTVALLYASVEAALTALLANLVLSLVEPRWLAIDLGLPTVVVEALRSVPLVGIAAPTTVEATSLVALALGAVAFGVGYAARLRRPLVEQFEGANPPVREALRTARDAVDDGADTEMARRLYADVVETLGSTSTLELVETRRVVVTVLLVVAVSVASVQVAVVDPDLAGLLGAGADPTVERPDDDGLQDGDEILGNPEDVGTGDDSDNISVPGTGEGSADGPTGPGGGVGSGGGGGEFDSQQSGYAGEERIEDAELVREYNLRIRELDGADTTSDIDDADTTNDAS
ncbi:DUF7502 family protein [Halobellus captivus]|uniref:DUF7502 family protein n=1 Tax=Halobellus captivus TaxID=2592614 RepID=UPI0011A8A45F|nr:hypothetical protein [Halobellus captivus]